MTNNENENLRTKAIDIITSTTTEYADQVEIDQTTIDDDPAITVTSQRPNKHTLNVRIEPSGLLVDVDESQAFEDFSSIVRSFCDGSLEILRGADGRYYGIRGAGFQLLASSSILQRFRSKPRKWVLLRQLAHE